jgi:signal peptidase I
MKPQLLAGDTIFVGKWPQKLDQNILPSRGDVVVFTNSAGTTAKSSDYIRRVVGLPGDVLTLKAGHLFLNGKSLLVKEKQSENPSCFVEKLSKNIEYQVCSESSFFPDFGPEKVPENSVFVIEDSRTVTQQNTIELQGALKRKGWGIIPISSIKGKALWIWLSIEETEKPSWLPRLRLERMFRRI